MWISMCSPFLAFQGPGKLPFLILRSKHLLSWCNLTCQRCNWNSSLYSWNWVMLTTITFKLWSCERYEVLWWSVSRPLLISLFSRFSEQHIAFCCTTCFSNTKNTCLRLPGINPLISTFLNVKYEWGVLITYFTAVVIAVVWQPHYLRATMRTISYELKLSLKRCMWNNPCVWNSNVHILTFSQYDQ